MIKTEFIVAVPKTAEGKRAFVDGLGHAVDHVQAYAIELFLTGGPDGEVPSQRLRDLAKDLMLFGAKIIGEAQAIEKQEAAAAHEKMMSQMKPPPTPPHPSLLPGFKRQEP